MGVVLKPPSHRHNPKALAYSTEQNCWDCGDLWSPVISNSKPLQLSLLLSRSFWLPLSLSFRSSCGYSCDCHCQCVNTIVNITIIVILPVSGQHYLAPWALTVCALCNEV